MSTVTNVLELKAQMKKNNITQEKLATELKITTASCNKKVNGAVLFKIPEIIIVTKTLKLSKEMMLYIFFGWL